VKRGDSAMRKMNSAFGCGADMALLIGPWVWGMNGEDREWIGISMVSFVAYADSRFGALYLILGQKEQLLPSQVSVATKTRMMTRSTSRSL